MKVSTKGRYALRIMLDLALSEKGKPYNLKRIAENQDISEKYMEQIMAMLHKAGYVNSVRGAQGGYMLAMEPEEYTVGMILRATEELEPVGCIDDSLDCARKDTCATVYVWERMYEAINQTLDSITLDELVEIQKSKCGRNIDDK